MARPPKNQDPITNPPAFELPENSTPVLAEASPEAAEQTGKPLTADLQEVDEFLKSAQLQGGSVRVTRKGPNDLQHFFIHTWPVNEFSYDMLRNDFGGGEYRLQFLDQGKKYLTMRTIHIAPYFKGRITDPEIKQIAAESGDKTAMLALIAQLKNNHTPAGNDTNSMLMPLFAAMMQSQQTMVTALAGAFQHKDNSSSVEAYMPLMLKMIESRNGGGSSTIREQIDALAMLNDFKAGKRPALPPEEKEEGLLSTLTKTLAPLVMSYLASKTGQMPQMPQMALSSGMPPQSSQPPGNSTSASAAPMAEVFTGDPSKDSIITQIRSFLPYLIKAASTNKPVGPILQYIESASDNELDALHDILQSEDWLKVLFDNHPGVIQFAPWFHSLRNEFLKEETADPPIETEAL
jgi:hypothetical protein